MKKPVKVAIIGTGGVSDSHVDAWKRCDGVEIAAVVDINQTQAITKLDKWGIDAEVYQTVEELVHHNRPDLVDICTPEHVHHFIGLQVVQAGIPVFSEKMLAANLEEGFDMMRTAKDTGVWTAINYNYHYFPCFSLLKQIVSEKNHGAIREVYVHTHSFCFHHVLEALIWIFGIPSSVFADGKDRNWPTPLEDQFKIAENLLYIPSNSFSAKMRYEDGLSIQINASLHQSLQALPFTYTCLFESGEVLQASDLDWANNMVGRVYWLPDGENLLTDAEKRYNEKSNLLGFRESIHQVAAHFMNGKKAPSTWEDGWIVMVLDHAMYLSGQKGTSINTAELKRKLEAELEGVAHE